MLKCLISLALTNLYVQAQSEGNWIFFLLREVDDYINSMKTAFDFNFDQAVKQLDST